MPVLRQQSAVKLFQLGDKSELVARVQPLVQLPDPLLELLLRNGLWRWGRQVQGYVSAEGKKALFLNLGEGFDRQRDLLKAVEPLIKEVMRVARQFEGVQPGSQFPKAFGIGGDGLLQQHGAFRVILHQAAGARSAAGGGRLFQIFDRVHFCRAIRKTQYEQTERVSIFRGGKAGNDHRGAQQPAQLRSRV